MRSRIVTVTPTIHKRLRIRWLIEHRHATSGLWLAGNCEWWQNVRGPTVAPSSVD